MLPVVHSTLGLNDFPVGDESIFNFDVHVYSSGEAVWPRLGKLSDYFTAVYSPEPPINTPLFVCFGVVMEFIYEISLHKVISITSYVIQTV